MTSSREMLNAITDLYPRKIIPSLIVSVCLLVQSCSTAAVFPKETPGQRFERAMKGLAEYCARHPPKPTDSACAPLKLKPADPLATEEGRFAHSIKIPNPVPVDSGYKPGMTPEEYFDHLCKTEAGEFIYKTVENVEGLYMMRPRNEATDYELENLYALEDPYGQVNYEVMEPGAAFVHPLRYQYLEMPVTGKVEPAWRKSVHPSRLGPPPLGAMIERHFGYDGHKLTSMQRDFATVRRSRYGFTWRGIQRPHDRELGIAGGELIVIDLGTNEVLGVRRGYIRSGGMKNLTGIWWMTGRTCPSYNYRNRDKDFDFSYWFIGKVLRPVSFEQSFEELTNAK